MAGARSWVYNNKREREKERERERELKPDETVLCCIVLYRIVLYFLQNGQAVLGEPNSYKYCIPNPNSQYVSLFVGA